MSTDVEPIAVMVEVKLDDSCIYVEPELVESICRRCGKPFQRSRDIPATNSNYYRCKDCTGSFLILLEDSCIIS
jgi:DNA-directed RNA polymerase subunit RPC12/RpoP